jgi:hypothetical protein
MYEEKHSRLASSATADNAKIGGQLFYTRFGEFSSLANFQMVDTQRLNTQGLVP